MVNALSGMQNLVFAQAAAADGFLEISVRRLIGMHLLRGNNKIKFNRSQLLASFSEKIIIDVGNDPQPEPPG